MFKIKIVNRAWLKMGEYGDYKTREDAKAQMLEYAAQSDADEWDFSGEIWYGILVVDGIKHRAVSMEIIEARSIDGL